VILFEITRVPQNCHPYVVLTTVIACGSKYCHRIISLELSWNMVLRIAIRVVPRIAMTCGPHNFHYMWSQELTTVYGPYKWHCIWFTELPLHVVPRIVIACGSAELPCHVVPQLPSACDPTTAIRMWSHKCHPYVFPTNANLMWCSQMPSCVVPQLPSLCGPTNAILCGPTNAIRMYSPQMPSLCGAHKCHPYMVPTNAILYGPTTAILTWVISVHRFVMYVN
jgi:hypothetical protein